MAPPQITLDDLVAMASANAERLFQERGPLTDDGIALELMGHMGATMREYLRLQGGADAHQALYDEVASSILSLLSVAMIWAHPDEIGEALHRVSGL